MSEGGKQVEEEEQMHFVECGTCKGKGRCKDCKGSGNANGIVGEFPGDCDTCSGMGHCTDCDGSGEVEGTEEDKKTTLAEDVQSIQEHIITGSVTDEACCFLLLSMGIPQPSIERLQLIQATFNEHQAGIPLNAVLSLCLAHGIESFIRAKE